MDKETRPLVTLGLFTFNQEAFVREAVASALNQMYSPLEIVISGTIRSSDSAHLASSRNSSRAIAVPTLSA